MAYRNIFFQKEVPILTGDTIVEYYGRLVPNAENCKSFFKDYDPQMDLYLPCGKCAKKKYKQFIKIEK